MPSQYALPEHSVSRMLWSVNGGASSGAVSPAMVVSPVPDTRPADVVESASHAFTVPVIICEDVDAEQRMTPEHTTLTRLSPPCNARRFLQVPGIDVGVERRPPS
uniref:Protein ovary overexpressed n=1 Tax=Rhipicephalus microplus TaxID=6941 RepID=A0A6M2D220_RHIMP